MSDLIDRQTAIDALGKRPALSGKCEWEIAARKQYDADRAAIESVPSAQPERKTGRWEKVYGDHIRAGHRPWTVCCSECGMIGGGTRYCPNCGARMEEDNGRPD